VYIVILILIDSLTGTPELFRSAPTE
jgi:hypothetical protein